MLAGIRGLAGFRQGSSVRTWLVSILRNRLMDHFRKSSRESTRQAEEADLEAYFAANGHWLAQQSNPERHRQFRDLMKILLCLGELNERSKRLFLMAEFEGMDPSELAEPFALNPENVRVWRSRRLRSASRSLRSLSRPLKQPIENQRGGQPPRQALYRVMRQSVTALKNRQIDFF